MKNIKLMGATAMLLVASLVATSCAPALPTTTELNAINIAAIAATISVPILESHGVVSLDAGNAILAYAARVEDATAKATTELQSADSTAVKYDVIIQDFAIAAVSGLPKDMAPSAQAIVSAIQLAVETFLTPLKTPAVKAMVKAPSMQKVKIPVIEKMRLRDIGKKAVKTSVTAKSLLK